VDGPLLASSTTLVGAAMCPTCFMRHIEPLAITVDAGAARYELPSDLAAEAAIPLLFPANILFFSSI
jgi:hypothetical protein